MTAAFPEESFALLEALEDRSFWFRARNELLCWALGRYFPNARSFFELGCGTGYVLRGLEQRYPDLRLAGGEIAPQGLAVARRRLVRATLHELDGRSLPFQDEFDVVGAFDVLEHIDDDTRVLEQLHVATSRNGGLLVTVPQHPRLWSRVDEFSRHVRRYTRTELVSKAERAGWRPVRVTSFVSALLPVLALSRLRERRLSPDDYDPQTEHSLPRVVDLPLGAAMAVERALIRLGVSFPAGGSLLLVARRD